tara:strand:+ start:780 stop:1748 length:969 start_codon:yes stop_codon:yes gene_type:complete
MLKPIAIVLGEPNSIFSELMFKVNLLKKKKFSPFFLIGNFNLIKKQSIYLKYNLKFNKINKKFKTKDLKKNTLSILDVSYSQNVPFKKISKKSNKFIFECFEIAIDLANKKKISGIINGPIAKETLLKGKFDGMTEYFSNKTGSSNKEVMLIYNKKLAVSPITTHVPVNKVSPLINKKKIINNVITIVNFYKKNFNKQIKIAITGLNPHCYSAYKNDEESLIIKPAIKFLKKRKFNIFGPLSADTTFIKKNLNRFDVIIGMYHDQVLAPFKTLFEQKAINITLGIPFIRISPDHGVGSDIVGKKQADPTSLIECINFFKNLK